MVAFLASLCAPSARGGAFCDAITKVLEESATRTVLEISWPDDLRGPRDFTLQLAVPDAGGATAHLLSVELATAESWLGVEQLAALGGEFVHVEPAARFRDQWFCTVQLHSHRRGGGGSPVERLARLRVAFEMPRGAALSAAPARESREDPLLQAALRQVLNPRSAESYAAFAAQASAGKRGGVFDDAFAKSEHWLRMEIDGTGIHRLGYEALVAELGAARTQRILSASVRLLTAAQVVQPLLPSDPNGSWAPGQELRERALEVRAAATTLLPGDEFLFYAVGPQDWLDRYNPSAPVLDHFEHEFADHLVYWLCWDEVGETSGFATAPLRMASVDATPILQDLEVDHYRERLHLEQNVTDQYGDRKSVV